MRRILILPILILTLLVANPAFSADYQKGLTALKSGDYATALREITPLAKQGNARAQNNLGQMYFWGQGVPRDKKTAVKLYTRAAEQGHAIAQWNLAGMYFLGNGVIQDNVYAHMWFNISASNGAEVRSNMRGVLADMMTPSQLEKAQDLARECVRKNYKGC